jgi:hypothetical protein
MRKQRILVRIKANSGEYTRVRPVNDDGKSVTMRKGKGKAEWRVTFDLKDIYFTRHFFKWIRTIDVTPDATKAVCWDLDKKFDVPRYDRKTSHDLVTLGVLKLLASEFREKITLIQIALILFMVVNIGISYLIGRRLGAF